MKDVTVVGGVFREILDGDTEPHPRMGGSGLTSAIVAARLGATTSLTSYVGEEDAQTVQDMLEVAGVDTNSLSTLPGASGTFVFPKEVGESSPWPMYRPAETTSMARPSVADSKLYLVFGIPDIDPIAENWLVGIRDTAMLLWDRQGWMSRARDCRAAGSLGPRERFYIANLEEALEEFPPEDRMKKFADLPPAGFSAAVVKQGANGCTVVRNGLGTAFDAFRVDDPHSTVGSGDAFAGGLAAALSMGETLESAVVVANAAAATLLQANGDPLIEWFADRVRQLVDERCDVERHVR